MAIPFLEQARRSSYQTSNDATGYSVIVVCYCMPLFITRFYYETSSSPKQCLCFFPFFFCFFFADICCRLVGPNRPNKKLTPSFDQFDILFWPVVIYSTQFCSVLVYFQPRRSWLRWVLVGVSLEVPTCSKLILLDCTLGVGGCFARGSYL